MPVARGIGVLTLLLYTVHAFAHGTSIFVSTPVSPAKEFVPYAIASLLLLGIVNTMLIRHLRPTSFPLAVLGGLLATALPGFLALQFGRWHTGLSTGPEPGLAWGIASPFYGYGWNDIGYLFLPWNLLVLLFFLCGTLLFIVPFINARPSKTLTHLFIWLSIPAILYTVFIGVSGALMLCGLLFFWLLTSGFKTARKQVGITLIIMISVYLICLLPNIVTGAFTHGWTSFRSRYSCEHKLEVLGTALLRYADAHEKRLPEGRTFDEILPKIEPYLDERVEGEDTGFCPSGKAYHRHPLPYAWHANMAGKTLQQLKALREAQPVLSCPYCWQPYDTSIAHTLYTEDLLYPELGEVRCDYRR
ncbi:MAG: hypothetical protein ACYDCO_14430 [Armatimonadota bacterium]